LPSSPTIFLSETEVIQLPLTRRGTGPGLILVLPRLEDLTIKKEGRKCLDPEPVQKWAEEGFAVAGITPSTSNWSFDKSLRRCIDSLLELKELDIRDKFAVIVYGSGLLPVAIPAITTNSYIVALIVYGSIPTAISLSIPNLFHSTTKPNTEANPTTSIYTYTQSSPYFVLPQVVEYHPGSAALAHSRTLVFLRKWLGGPVFDLEAIWDEHTYFEFEDRSVAKTMGTMVAEPYVNHVPTMTGGVGRENLTAFYRDHFIFSNPPDAAMEVVSRTVGPDRVVDEFIYSFTHDRMVDWLLPGVPPSNKKLTIPMMAVVNIRGDRLYNEHIWWDQATALRQAGILPTYLPYTTFGPHRNLRLPVTGAESAAMLADEGSMESNFMFGVDWGLHDPHI